jgi:Spy/CpxP family protein refolding chaperone
MKVLRLTTVTLMLAAVVALPAAAQRGLGWSRGFTGIGQGNWALHEGGIDSLAAWFQLTDEQRGQFEELAAQFRRDNAEALDRWNNMQEEIQSLTTEDQRPTRAAIQRIGEKYNYPGEELRPALDQLRVAGAAILTPAQRQSAGRRLARRATGTRGRVGIQRGRMDRRRLSPYELRRHDRMRPMRPARPGRPLRRGRPLQE